MKEDLIIHKVDETTMYIETSPGIANELSDTFSFYASNYKFHPKFKARLWDGKIRLYDMRNDTMLLGLAANLINFCREKGYSYKFNFSKVHEFDPEVLKQVMDSLDKNKIRSLYPHQEQAIDFALKSSRCVIESATGSGKSLPLYIIIMYYLFSGYENALLITPKVGLCEQTKLEFIDYTGNYKKEFSESVGLLYNGSKHREGNIVIATWQSLKNMGEDYFKKYDIVVVDECHGASITSVEIKNIMQKCKNARFRFGFTATTSNPEDKVVNDLLLTGLFGPIKTVLTTSQGIDSGVLTKPIIHACKLNYDDKAIRSYIHRGNKEIRDKYDENNLTENQYKTYRKELYDNEISYICQLYPRNRFIAELALKLEGNVLIFFNFIDSHGKIIYDLLQEKSKNTGKEILYIDGNVGANEREKIRAKIERQNNLILCASLGTTSTGINAKNLNHLIFANINKSFKTVKQSIGRMLRTLDGKTGVNIYDLGDCFGKYRGKNNFLYNHFEKRIGFYMEEGHEVIGKEYTLKNNSFYE